MELKFTAYITLYTLLFFVHVQRLSAGNGPYPQKPTVTISSGVLIGTTTSLPDATGAINQFLGVPFAQSPPKRFTPPQDPEPWPTPRQAKIMPACIQQWNYPEPLRSTLKSIWNNPGGPPPEESEDCLYLNVYAPASPPPPGGRSVMVWFYGGSFSVCKPRDLIHPFGTCVLTWSPVGRCI